MMSTVNNSKAGDIPYKYFGVDQDFYAIVVGMESILATLKSRDINVHPECRFAKFHRELKRLMDGVKQGNESAEFLEQFDIALLAEGIRDYSELKIISASSTVLKNAREDLSKIIGGTSFPSQDSATLARNLQYQLYVAATFDCSRMGITISEPDFIFDFKGQKYSVAAKRLVGKTSVLKRIKEAEQQIKKNGYDGFIALSLDRLLSKKDQYLVTGNPNNIPTATNKTLLKLIKENIPVEGFSKRDSQVIGIIASLSLPAVLPGCNLGYGSSMLFLSTVEQSDPRYRLSAEMSHHLTPLTK